MEQLEKTLVFVAEALVVVTERVHRIGRRLFGPECAGRGVMEVLSTGVLLLVFKVQVVARKAGRGLILVPR